MSNDPVGRKVFGGGMGYPKGRFQGSFDPAMGRGYRGGDRVIVPAGEQKLLCNHGQKDEFFRWKISLFAETDASGVYTANTAYYVAVVIAGKNENDNIERDTIVGLGRGQVLYVPGRSLRVTAQNPTDQPIVIHYSLDEATPGLAAWTTDEQIEVSAETPLDVAAFAQQLQVFGLAGGVNWTLRGYDASGTLVYSEVVNAPRSAPIALVPSLYYTIQPTIAGTYNCMIVYSCLG